MSLLDFDSETRQQYEPSVFRLEPTPEIIQVAHDTIETHETAISSLESQIAHLLEQIRDLRATQARHRIAIARARGLVTLARRLPQELLIKIFVHCVEDGWTRAPVAVSHVCSAWRKAAHAPVVWSHVYARCDDANVLPRTRFWLEMARAADLHVTVAASWRTSQRLVEQVMTLLVERSAQWHTLRIEMDTFLHADRILRHCDRIVSQLRGVALIGRLDHGVDALDADVAELSGTFDAAHAPLLASVTYSTNVVPSSCIFPTHITNLTLHVYDSLPNRPVCAVDLVKTLRELTDLQTLTLSMPLVRELEYVPAPEGEELAFTASLPSLTALTLYGPTDLNEFLPHIHAPALRRLRLRSLEDLGYRQQPIGPSLTRFLEASAPPLELLELHDIDLDPETFATTFAALPSLRELRLHESSISDATVRLLLAETGLCPRLERLDLRWCGMLHGSALVDLVRSRTAGLHGAAAAELERTVAPIEEVAVINCAFVLEADVLALARTTVCRIVMRDGDDYCRTIGCCGNARYRMRLQLKHLAELHGEGMRGICLVL